MSSSSIGSVLCTNIQKISYKLEEKIGAMLSIVDWEKQLFCTSSATLDCYAATIWQLFVLNSVSRNNEDFFKLCYPVAAIGQHWVGDWLLLRLEQS